MSVDRRESHCRQPFQLPGNHGRSVHVMTWDCTQWRESDTKMSHQSLASFPGLLTQVFVARSTASDKCRGGKAWEQEGLGTRRPGNDAITVTLQELMNEKAWESSAKPSVWSKKHFHAWIISLFKCCFSTTF